MSGRPGAKEVGANTFVVKVSDGKVGDDSSDVKVTVIHTNHAPKWTANPIELPEAYTWQVYRRILRDMRKTWMGMR